MKRPTDTSDMLINIIKAAAIAIIVYIIVKAILQATS